MTPRWDDPESFRDRLPSDHNARGVFAEGPQPPSNPLARVQGGRPVDASRHALPTNVARAVLSRAGQVRQKLKLALFVHTPRPPRHPIISTWRATDDPTDDGPEA